MWVLRGTCGEPHPSINRAELSAVIAVLRTSAGGLEIRSDSAFVVDGYRAGKKITTSSSYEAADLWRDFWAIVEEIGGDKAGTGGVAIEKVKAHSTWADIVEGRVNQSDHVGNNAADKAAKEALAVAKSDSPATEFNAAIARAVLWAKWIMNYTRVWDPTWPDEVEKAEEALVREAGQEGGSERAVRQSVEHELWERREGLRCRRCGRESKGGAPIPTFGSDACKGCAAGKVMASDTGNINYLWHEHKYSKEEMAVQGFTLRKKGVIPSCAIDEARLHEVERRPGGTTTGARGRDISAMGGVSTGRRDLEDAEEEAAPITGRHAIRRMGGLMWCDVCGAYATQRAGARLRGQCLGGTGNRHRATRLARLRQGRHPISNQALEGTKEGKEEE